MIEESPSMTAESYWRATSSTPGAMSILAAALSRYRFQAARFSSLRNPGPVATSTSPATWSGWAST